ncbi:MAG TPA: ABC transporter permease [Acidimicrobiales bacterium]
MLQLIGRRLASGCIVLILVSLVVYALVLLIPGDAAIRVAGESASEEQVEEVRHELGLDRPVYRQYLDWAGDALRGDLGNSLISRQAVTEAITQRLPATLSLTVAALTVTLVIAIPAGVIAAMNQGRLADRLVTSFASLGVAVPSFWLGLVLVAYVARRFDFLPASRYTPFSESPSEWLRSLVLPAIALGLAPAAEVARQLRSALVDTLGQDYVRTARAKGLRRRSVIGKHALKNASLPVITVLGIQFTLLLSTAVIVEQVFSFQGLGTLAYRAASDRDIPVIQGVVVFTTLAVIIVNLLVDISYGLLNPKVRSR